MQDMKARRATTISSVPPEILEHLLRLDLFSLTESYLISLRSRYLSPSPATLFCPSSFLQPHHQGNAVTLLATQVDWFNRVGSVVKAWTEPTRRIFYENIVFKPTRLTEEVVTNLVGRQVGMAAEGQRPTLGFVKGAEFELPWLPLRFGGLCL